MLYDPKNPIDRERATRRMNEFFQKGQVFDLTGKNPKRTIRQNSYLHLILGYFAVETGYTMEWVKEKYFKTLCNKDIFYRVKHDKFLGDEPYYRSSKDLDTGEMTTAIQRFRSWSSSEAGIYLPEPNEDKFLQYIEIELQRHKEYL